MATSTPSDIESDSESRPSLTEVKGVGDAYADKLQSAGIGSIDGLANADVEELAATTDIPSGRVENIISRARAFDSSRHASPGDGSKEESDPEDSFEAADSLISELDVDVDDVGEVSHPLLDADQSATDESTELSKLDEALNEKLTRATDIADSLDDAVSDELFKTALSPSKEDEFFFSAYAEQPTTVTRYDLEQAIPDEQKTHLREVDRYWVNKPYAFVSICYHQQEHEHKYYVVEPYLSDPEEDVLEYLRAELRETIRYSDESPDDMEDRHARAELIQDYVLALLDEHDLNPLEGGEEQSPLWGDAVRDSPLFQRFISALPESLPGIGRIKPQTRESGDEKSDGDAVEVGDRGNEGDDWAAEMPQRTNRSSLYASNPDTTQTVRPEYATRDEAFESLSPYQLDKLLYYLKRDFVGYGPIDPVKHDINVEDISMDGYGTPVFVYHTEHEQLITNIDHGDEDNRDDFVIKLAQRAGKGISKREPQVDATLEDGSRAQLTLGTEVSGHGSNYTIRQFKDVPFTPVDLINWGTMSIDQLAFLWLAIENNQSIIFAGGTASGKTTTLNAASLFIPSNTKIVTIEDTRELKLPQRNWVSGVTRDSFSDGDSDDIDEFDLLESALRQRPDYIIMGEVRGEEGRTLFQVMSTGHTTYTTFHADNVDEVFKRFTSDPINVSEMMFGTLDLAIMQTQTEVDGRTVRRVKSITEIEGYDADDEQLVVSDVYEWDINSDSHRRQSGSETISAIQQLRGWSEAEIERQFHERQVVLAYLAKHGFNSYANVAATIQAYMNDPELVLQLIASGTLEEHLDGLQKIDTVEIDIDPQTEALVPRPEPSEDTLADAEEVLREAREGILSDFASEVSGNGN